MTNLRGKDRDPPHDDATHLTEDDVERRLGGGAGLGAVVARVPEPPPPPLAGRPPRPPRRSRGGAVLWRDVFLVLVLLGFLGVGAQFVLQQPSAALVPPSPGASSVALASASAVVVPSPSSTTQPTDIRLPSEVIGSLLPEVTATPVPTPTPSSTPTPAPGATPHPTPQPTPHPTPTPTPPPVTTATLRVYVDVINDDGGTATSGGWTVKVTGASAAPASFVGPSSGTFRSVTVKGGIAYSLSASGVSGYLKSASGDCSGSIPAGATGNCTITEDDRPAYVEVTTLVQTGAANPSDFTIALSAAGASPGSHDGSGGGFTYAFDAHAAYSFSVSNPNGYTVATSSGCDGAGVGGAVLTCVITLNSGSAPVTGEVGGTGSVAAFLGLPLLALPRLRRRRDAGELVRP